MVALSRRKSSGAEYPWIEPGPAAVRALGQIVGRAERINARIKQKN